MKEISLKNTIYITDLLLELSKEKYNETQSERYLALCDLAFKLKACMNAVALFPLSDYNVLCVPVNLLYRCMITDLMTALLLSVVDDITFNKIMHIMDIDYVKSLIKAINAEVEVKKSVCPEKASAFEKAGKDYQIQHYDDLKDCLKSSKGELWKIQSKEKLAINNVCFSGQIESIYNILLTFNDVKDIACIYKYYRLFSQSEHFSLKNRVFNYKQDFHDTYYNKVRGLLYLGIEYIYKKYSTD